MLGGDPPGLPDLEKFELGMNAAFEAMASRNGFSWGGGSTLVHHSPWGGMEKPLQCTFVNSRLGCRLRLGENMRDFAKHHTWYTSRRILVA